MSRIEQADKIRRSIERGEPQPTALHKLYAEYLRQQRKKTELLCIGAIKQGEE